MTYYERNLPHWHPDGRSLFITWRLHGSLPASVVSKFFSPSVRISGRQFRIVDRELDSARFEPMWLKDESVADSVVRSICHGESALCFYNLHACMVMANHVHVLVSPKVTAARITNGIKGVSARDANVILGRIGMKFWQSESFDHWVRNASEFERVRKYIEGNPVIAGLVKSAEEWRWSSAFRTRSRIAEGAAKIVCAASNCSTRD